MSAIECDLAVIGAGIHGCGVALAASAAGYEVVMIEREAPACGTSGKSSKLIHGGLRYLETGQLGLVRESLVERRWLLAHAPELVQAVAMHIPVYESNRRPHWMIRAGLSAYALLAGLGDDARYTQLGRSQWGGLDGLRTDGLRAVYRYPEARTDDVALTRAILAAAVRLGCEVWMPAQLVAAEIDEAGVTLVSDGGGQQLVLRAAAVVNATGPWAVSVAELIRPSPPPPAVELVQGSHLVFPGALARGGYYTEAHDGRAVFMLPHANGTMVGTTEFAYTGDPAQCAPTAAEREYLTQAFVSYFPGRAAERPVESWAGLRVLPADGVPLFRRPRETRFHVDDANSPRMVGIFGGKLTTWRSTAKKTLKKLRPSLPDRKPRQDLDRLELRTG